MSDESLRETEHELQACPSEEAASSYLRQAARAGQLSIIPPSVLLEALIEAAPPYAQNTFFNCRSGNGNVLGCEKRKVPRWCSTKNVGRLGICLMCCAEHGCEAERYIQAEVIS